MTVVLLWQSPSSLYGSHLHMAVYLHMAVIFIWPSLSSSVMLTWRISSCDCYLQVTVILVWPSSCHLHVTVTFTWQPSSGTVHLLLVAVTLLWPSSWLADFFVWLLSSCGCHRYMAVILVQSFPSRGRHPHMNVYCWRSRRPCKAIIFRLLSSSWYSPHIAVLMTVILMCLSSSCGPHLPILWCVDNPYVRWENQP